MTACWIYEGGEEQNQDTGYMWWSSKWYACARDPYAPPIQPFCRCG